MNFRISPRFLCFPTIFLLAVSTQFSSAKRVNYKEIFGLTSTSPQHIGLFSVFLEICCFGTYLKNDFCFLSISKTTLVFRKAGKDSFPADHLVHCRLFRFHILIYQVQRDLISYDQKLIFCIMYWVLVIWDCW